MQQKLLTQWCGNHAHFLIIYIRSMELLVSSTYNIVVKQNQSNLPFWCTFW